MYPVDEGDDSESASARKRVSEVSDFRCLPEAKKKEKEKKQGYKEDTLSERGSQLATHPEKAQGATRATKTTKTTRATRAPCKRTVTVGPRNGGGVLCTLAVRLDPLPGGDARAGLAKMNNRLNLE